MAEPRSNEEYTNRFLESQHVSGYGIYGVTQHFPCPFCAAPNWMVIRLIDFPDKATDQTCTECGRSAIFLVERTAGSMSIELVQTGGADPPPWLQPRPRRFRPSDQEAG